MTHIHLHIKEVKKNKYKKKQMKTRRDWKVE